jgi:acetylornithine deacetylase/succinyl-diaminopimelate desuccinylase-like protein
MHKIDEHVAIEDIDRLAAIYAEMLVELDRN